MADAPTNPTPPVPPTLDQAVLDTLLAGVSGKGAHVDSERILDGLDWPLAGRAVEGSPYTILQSANHIIFWNGYATAHLDGLKPTPPAHAPDGWPGPAAVGSATEWDAFVRAYKASLEALARAARTGAPNALVVTRTRLDVLRAMLQHVSYHVGQIALLRRMLGAWPPPGGGDTW
jgi:hypothetical protein